MWSEECGVRSEITALRRFFNLKSWLSLFSLLTPLSSLLSHHSSLHTPLIYYFSSKMFIISTAALATDVPGPKMAATPA